MSRYIKHWQYIPRPYRPSKKYSRPATVELDHHGNPVSVELDHHGNPVSVELDYHGQVVGGFGGPWWAIAPLRERDHHGQEVDHHGQAVDYHGQVVGDYVDAGPQEAFGNYVDVPGYMGDANAKSLALAGFAGTLLSFALTGFAGYGIYKFATRKK